MSAVFVFVTDVSGMQICKTTMYLGEKISDLKHRISDNDRNDGTSEVNMFDIFIGGQLFSDNEDFLPTKSGRVVLIMKE